MRNAAMRIIREIGVDTGGSNIQFAVNPDTGAMVIIEMNPRVSRVLGAGVQGDRLPHREDRREAGRRLHPRRDPQRHHAGDPGVVRADDRLRGDEDPPLHLREVPPDRGRAGHPDEVGRRGDGDRPDLPGIAAEGDALPGDGHRTGSTRCCPAATPANAASRRKEIAEKLRKPNSRRLLFIGEAFRDGWTIEEIRRAHRDRPVVPGAHPADHRDGGRDPRARGGVPRSSATARGRMGPFFRKMKENGFSDRRLAKLLGSGEDVVRRARYAAGVRAVFKRVDTCGAEFVAHTPYLYSTYESESEGGPTDRKKDRHPRGRPEPDRAGDRVRLLLRPRRHRPPGGGVRDDHGELQPRDGLHRLRHLRPALLRAADEGGRPRHRRGGEPGRRHRPVRRADAARSWPSRWRRRACGSWGPPPRASTGRRTGSGSRRC